ncbi:MAG TPA: glycosyltransferase family 2 protein, partial [Anaerolineales bacterium]|nr:glycosyltransferase family 2 protein [Anaerolineales bacterium]
SHSILIVDNGSTEGSVESIRNQYPTVNILPTGKNLGYAEGNNVGIRWAVSNRADYVFVMNNDVRVAQDVLEPLISAAECDPKIAFLGPKVFQLEMPDQIQSAGGKLDYLWRSNQRGLDSTDIGHFETIEVVDYVIGAAVLVKAKLLAEIGLLDADYFLYREDVDWCLRARRKGYRVVYVPEAKVWHRSLHVRESELPRITYYLTRNSLLLLKKQRAGFLRFFLVLLQHLRTAVSWTVKPKWREKRAERDALIKGILDFFQGKVGQGYA